MLSNELFDLNLEVPDFRCAHPLRVARRDHRLKTHPERLHVNGLGYSVHGLPDAPDFDDLHAAILAAFTAARNGADDLEVFDNRAGLDVFGMDDVQNALERSRGLPFPIYTWTHSDHGSGSAELVRLWERVGLTASASEVLEMVNGIMRRAVTCKEATVPPRALFELNVGPYQLLEVEEFSRHVNFRLRTGPDVYGVRGIVSIGYDMSAADWVGLESVVDASFDAFEEAYYPESGARSEADEEAISRECDEFIRSRTAGVQLLLSAILHDCWIVDSREGGFGSKRVPHLERWMPKEQDGRTIVYLPRIRYVRNDRVVDFRRASSAISHRAHPVRAHTRRLADQHSAGAAARKLAAIYGVDLPESYTFVGPHERGQEKQEVMYRSRSALRLLFEHVDQPEARTPPHWRRFEADVRKALSSAGVAVLKWAVSGKGDDGIDIEAIDYQETGPVALLVQCKCWRRDRRVGPAVVRELAGAVSGFLTERPELDPSDVRGVVITTSSFTQDALDAASGLGIRLIDGEQLAGSGESVAGHWWMRETRSESRAGTRLSKA